MSLLVIYTLCIYTSFTHALHVIYTCFTQPLHICTHHLHVIYSSLTRFIHNIYTSFTYYVHIIYASFQRQTFKGLHLLQTLPRLLRKCRFKRLTFKGQQRFSRFHVFFANGGFIFVNSRKSWTCSSRRRRRTKENMKILHKDIVWSKNPASVF